MHRDHTFLFLHLFFDANPDILDPVSICLEGKVFCSYGKMDGNVECLNWNVNSFCYYYFFLNLIYKELKLHFWFRHCYKYLWHDRNYIEANASYWNWRFFQRRASGGFRQLTQIVLAHSDRRLSVFASFKKELLRPCMGVLYNIHKRIDDLVCFFSES